MHILITGAGGNLGRVVAPALAAQGHTLRLMDFRPIELDGEFVQGDVRDPDAVARAVDGVDAIVHAAALHGIHLRQWAPADFWAINATGTFHVYDAARKAGVRRIVLCSTMGVYGHSAHAPADSWNVVTEALPLLPGDVYGLSKVVCETTAAHFARAAGIMTVALRLGMFVPEGSLHQYGFRLLFGGVDDRDVAQAVVRALRYDAPGGFDAFDIMADTRLEPDDLRALHDDPVAAVERRYPGMVALCAARGIEPRPLLWGRTLWPVEKARRLLGYAPEYDFAGFLTALEAGDERYYPYVGLPWWGV